MLCSFRQQLQRSVHALVSVIGVGTGRHEQTAGVLQGVKLEKVLIGSNRTLSRYWLNSGSLWVLAPKLDRILFPGSTHTEISILESVTGISGFTVKDNKQTGLWTTPTFGHCGKSCGSPDPGTQRGFDSPLSLRWGFSCVSPVIHLPRSPESLFFVYENQAMMQQ